MSKISTLTVGIDLGDVRSRFYVVDGETGEVRGEGHVAMKRPAMTEWLDSLPPSRVVLEAGTQSPWVSQVAEDAGHEVIVAQPSKVRLISRSSRKSDEADARLLARLGRADPELLFPVKHRGPDAQAHRALLTSRDVLVRSRTTLVNHCRTTVKVFGERVPSCSTKVFAKRARKSLTGALLATLEPVLVTIDAVSKQIAFYDKEIGRLCRERYPETKRLTQVSGVAELTALAFVLTIDDPWRFRRSRQVGPYLGLVPRRRQSGNSDQQLRITKCGDRTMRRLLVGAAQYILGAFGPDTALRRWGHGLSARGGRNAKKRAVVAVARRLAVLLHRLWVSGETYDPLRGAGKKAD